MTDQATASTPVAAADPSLITIPYVDIRDTSALKLVTEHKSKTINLLNASRNSFGLLSRILSYIALPIGDYLSGRWLKKTDNPYRDEIHASAKAVRKKGVVALNMSYEWGCSTGAFAQDDAQKPPMLARILDWPFPALGENIVVAHQTGPAGDFHNVTWPGVSGVFQACAQGRFAAALNQAPMRRHKTGIIIDWLRNRHLFNKETGLPPAHLLRKAFEKAATYDEAKKMLATEPVSIPVLYVLTGTKPGEGCVIERTEHDAVIRDMQNGRVTVANHFESRLNGTGHGWMPRANDSNKRGACISAIPAEDVGRDFDWYVEPIANNLSRLAMTADASTGAFKVIGTAGVKQVTNIFKN